MTQEYAEISAAAEALEKRIDEKQARMEAHGVLDGEMRLKLRDASIDIARLKEQLRRFGDVAADQHATDAANLKALGTQLDYWAARIDRDFKA